MVSLAGYSYTISSLNSEMRTELNTYEFGKQKNNLELRPLFMVKRSSLKHVGEYTGYKGKILEAHL